MGFERTEEEGWGKGDGEDAERGGGRGRDRGREAETGEPRARKPFGKFHNRTCRICPDYFNIFDSSRESVCERVYA